VGEHINVVNNVSEVSSQNQTRSLVAQTTESLIGGLESGLGLGGQIEDKNGLINLHRLSAGSLELGKEVDVEREELRESRDGVNGLATVGLGQVKEGNGTQQDRASGDAELLGLVELSNGLWVGRELESLAILESGLDIVVV
jgi:hypothetical protein